MLLLPRCVLLHLLLLLSLLLLFLLFLLLHLFLLSEVDEHKMYYQLTALFMRRAAVFPFMARAADLNNDQPSDTHTHTQAHTCTPSHTRRHLHVVGGRSCSCCAVFRFLLVAAACSFSVSALYSLQVYSLQSSTVSTVFSCLSLSNSKS